MNLYDIDDRLVNLIENQFDTDDGTIYESEEELAKKIDEVSMELDTKIENIGLYIKNLESDIEALKKEEDNLHKRRKATENKIEGLKNYLNGYLTACYPNEDDRRKWKFKTPRVILGYRKSTTVEVPDIDSLDERFVRTKVEKVADKVCLKEALKNGEIKGAYLKENINLSIK